MFIGIFYYNIYNVLSVFVLEICGKWNFVVVFGIEYVDEYG